MSRKLKKTLAMILSLVTVFSATFTSMADEVEVVEAVEAVITDVEEVAEVEKSSGESLDILSSEELDVSVEDILGDGETTYTVHFDGHGSSSGSMDDQVMTYGVAANLKPNGFYPPSEQPSFAGWALTNTSAEPVYADQQLVKNLADPGGEITLYAVWKGSNKSAVIYTVDVERPEGGEIDNTVDFWERGGSPIGCTATANESYRFVGWKDADGHLITDDTDDVMLSNGGKTITPKQASGKDTYYTAVFEKQMTIADMLELSAMAFPTEEKYGWENNQSQGTRAYISDSSNLKFTPGNGGDSFAYPLTSPLTETSSGYQYSDAGVAIQFNLNDGVLENIEIPVCSSDDAFEGTYKPEIPTIAINAARTEYELGETIEFEITTTALQDGSEIEVSEGTHTWTKKVNNDQAAFSDSTKDTVGVYTYEVKIPQFGVSAFINITVKEPARKIDPPTADTHTYTYNGAKQTYSPVSFDPAAMVMENGVQKDAGTYEVKVSPAEGYAWAGGAADPTFTWSIQPAIIGGLQWYTTESKSYDGKALDTGIKGLDGVFSGDDCKLNCTLHKGTADGEVVSSATEVGIYVCVTDKNLSGTAAGNYMLSENITLPLSRTYTITPGTNPKPDPTPVEKESEEHEPLYTGTWNAPVKSGSWSQDAHGIWHYSSSETFRNTWGYIVNPYAKEGQNSADWFWFDRQGNMLTGWQFINGKWYYLNPTKDGTLGACQLGGVTPDGWTVKENGEWDESIPRK